MGKKAERKTLESMIVDVACLIHGDAYDWKYVENLYQATKNNSTAQVRFHVYTERNRWVPTYMIKHELENWPGIEGPKKAWWYKMQLFNSNIWGGQMLYLDLDTVITGNLDWIWQQNTKFFWSLRDFRYLFRPRTNTINSSVMWFDNRQWQHIWEEFQQQEKTVVMKKHRGDQDFISQTLDRARLAFMPQNRVISYRWQALDGGYDFSRRVHNNPGTGCKINDDVSLVIFHGNPKPHQVSDPLIDKHWTNDK